jgi:hypothetical protein
MNDPIDALVAFAAAPAPAFEPTDEDAFADPAFGRALTTLHRMSPGERERAVHRLAAAIPATADGYQAARLAVCCGTAVEWGVDPEIPGPAVIERLRAEAAAGVSDPRAERSLRLLCVAAMAVLCRSVALRQRSRALPGLAEALDPLALPEVDFVRIVLGLVDDLELLVLHLERPEGARIRLEAVACNFHLLTLLQAAFPAWCGDDPPDPEVVAQARGEAPPAPVEDHARFHVSTAADLPAEGRSGPGAGDTGPSPASSALWGEATPLVIPEVGGVRALLVGPTLFGSRSWDSGFFPNLHDALHPAVHVVEVLSPEAVAAHLARLR